jgi:dTDP-4-amino-4,6-dideoxygalactose transaminase
LIPRKKLDIGWADLAFGLFACLLMRDRTAIRKRLEHWWSPDGNAFACLSVRTGFDLVLQRLALPHGSEVLVSAITIRDMVVVIEHHGLVAVPVDLEPGTCAVRPEALERAVTPKTKAVVIAHLFGNRTNMDGVVEFAQRQRLLLFEDCAQAFAADGYRGHANSDIVMFSFGTIKTATAGGGALFNFKNAALRNSVAGLHIDYPVQGHAVFAQKLLKIAFLRALAHRLPYTVFVYVCHAIGKNHDRVISDAVRGFPGGDLRRQLRQQPPAALLALLERRLRNHTPAMLMPRVHAAIEALQHLPAKLQLGSGAPLHSHWVFPVQSERPDQLVCHLWQHGFDATRGTSSMISVPAPAGAATACDAQRMIGQIVYLPVDCCTTEGEIERMTQLVAQFEAFGRQSM